MNKAVHINELDNVAIASVDSACGEALIVTGTEEELVINSDIKQGHKIALTEIPEGEYVVKYGIPIARATETIKRGDWVSSHNVKDITEELCNKYVTEFKKNPPETGYTEYKKPASIPTFMGYPRANGEVGIRNYVLVVSTVHCSGTAAKKIAAKTDTFAITHDFGCGESANPKKWTHDCLLNTCLHANVYGVVLVGLGCEQNKAKTMYDELTAAGKRVEYVVIQEEGGPDEAIKKGVAYVEQMKKEAAEIKRVPCPLSKLRVALQCGGSDWTTAISGNTTLGVAVDYLVENGATVFMSEIGGLPGSDHILAKNAISKEVALQIIDACEYCRKQHIKSFGTTIEESNPTPGNKEGGITTLVEKSTGNIKKAGTSPIRGVLGLFEKPSDDGGIWLVDHKCEGLESVTITAQALSGAQMLIFTTGRGTPVGNVMIPVYRLTGNPESYKMFPSMIDFNAGVVVEGASMDETGKDLYNKTIEVAEGMLTTTEINGDYEYMILHPSID